MLLLLLPSLWLVSPRPEMGVDENVDRDDDHDNDNGDDSADAAVLLLWGE